MILTTCRLDEKTGFFKEGFEELDRKLFERHYISVAQFSADVTAVLSGDTVKPDRNNTNPHDVNEIHNQLNEIPAGTAEHLALTQEEKELKRLKKRIVKAIKDSLAIAMKREAELKDIPIENLDPRWATFDALLENSAQTNGTSALPTTEAGENISPDTSVSAVAGASPGRTNNRLDDDVDMADADADAEEDPDADGEEDLEINDTAHSSVDLEAVPAKGAMFRPAQPLSPPNSTSSIPINSADGNIDPPNQETAPSVISTQDPWAQGGVPWYFEHFDISGTTVYEERWTGRDALSEDLTDLDEEEVADLCEKPNGTTEGNDNTKSRTRSSARIKQAEESSTASNEEEEVTAAEPEQTEEQKAERAKKDRANARRRAARKRKW